MKNICLLFPIGLLSFSLLSFVSCDSSAPDSGSSSSGGGVFNSRVDPRLQVYLNEFLAEADSRGVALNGNRLSSLEMEFGDLEPGTIGLCTSGGLGNVITVSNDATPDEYRWVVIHELGHCILRMEHRDNALSVMNSSLSLGQLNRSNETSVFNEFFQERYYEGY